MGGTAFSVGAVFLHGIGTVLSWIVLSVYFGFFLTMETRKVNTESLLPFLKPETRSDVVYLIKKFVNIIVVFFRGQLIIPFFREYSLPLGLPWQGCAAIRVRHRLGFRFPQHHSLPGKHRRLEHCLARCLLSGGRGVGYTALGSCGLCCGATHRGLCADAQDHGQSHRSSLHGNHRGYLLLGCGAGRDSGCDFGYTPNGVPGLFLAFGQRKVYPRARLR